MIRKNPAQRRSIVHEHLTTIAERWLCHYGAWNRDKLMLDLEQALTARRKEQKKSRRVAVVNP